jgi:hypothetical protein
MWLSDASGELYRFDGDSDKGKGKSQGRDITDMFMFSGFVFHPDLDVNADGVVNELDVIADSCEWDADQSGTIEAGEVNAWSAEHTDPDDVNEDGVVNELDVIMDSCPYDVRINDGVISWDEDYDENTFPDCEFEDWLFDNATNAEGDPLWAYYDEEWIFTIADLVYLNQVVTNEGIKNVQIRFYPKDSTVFIPIESAVAKADSEGEEETTQAPPALSERFEFAALAAYPQPCNPELWIPYTLGEAVEIKITIYDLAGRLIRKLNLGHKPAGFYVTKDKAAYWDGKNEARETVSSGMYFYTIQANDHFVATRKIMVVR